MKNKKFDAVEITREIRDKISKIYVEDSETERRDLKTIRIKYGVKKKEEGQYQQFIKNPS